jgi:hypothetical protein
MSTRQARIAAIDPGGSGGIAWVDWFGEWHAAPIPKAPRDWFELLVELTPVKILVEKVGFHRIGNSASSSVKFARTCGLMEGFLIALEIPQEQVVPSKWMQGFLGHGNVPKERAARKNAIKAKVQMLRPGVKVTLDTADAVGMLIWYEEMRNK